MERWEVVVIGSGLVGAAVAFDLARNGIRTLVLETSTEIAAGASRSNSGILHTGFDSTPKTFETRMIRAQAERWQSLFDERQIPYRLCGALLSARTEEEAARLPAMRERAAENGVETELLGAEEAKRVQPDLSSFGALSISGEAITDPYEVVRRLLHVAGIRSTGLSACLGLSLQVLRMIERLGVNRDSTRFGTGDALKKDLETALEDDHPRPWWQRLNRLRGIG